MIPRTHILALEAGVQVMVENVFAIQANGVDTIQVGIEPITQEIPGFTFGGSENELLLTGKESQDIYLLSYGNTNVTIGY